MPRAERPHPTQGVINATAERAADFFFGTILPALRHTAELDPAITNNTDIPPATNQASPEAERMMTARGELEATKISMRKTLSQFNNAEIEMAWLTAYYKGKDEMAASNLPDNHAINTAWRNVNTNFQQTDMGWVPRWEARPATNAAIETTPQEQEPQPVMREHFVTQIDKPTQALPTGKWVVTFPDGTEQIFGDEPSDDSVGEGKKRAKRAIEEWRIKQKMGPPKYVPAVEPVPTTESPAGVPLDMNKLPDVAKQPELPKEIRDKLTEIDTIASGPSLTNEQSARLSQLVDEVMNSGVDLTDESIKSIRGQQSAAVKEAGKQELGKTPYVMSDYVFKGMRAGQLIKRLETADLPEQQKISKELARMISSDPIVANIIEQRVPDARKELVKARFSAWVKGEIDRLAQKAREAAPEDKAYYEGLVKDMETHGQLRHVRPFGIASFRGQRGPSWHGPQKTIDPLVFAPETRGRFGSDNAEGWDKAMQVLMDIIEQTTQKESTMARKANIQFDPKSGRWNVLHANFLKPLSYQSREEAESMVKSLAADDTPKVSKVGDSFAITHPDWVAPVAVKSAEDAQKVVESKLREMGESEEVAQAEAMDIVSEVVKPQAASTLEVDQSAAAATFSPQILADMKSIADALGISENDLRIRIQQLRDEKSGASEVSEMPAGENIGASVKVNADIKQNDGEVKGFPNTDVSAGKPGNFPKVPGMVETSTPMKTIEPGKAGALGLRSDQAKKFDVKIQHGLSCEKAHMAFASLTASAKGLEKVTAALNAVSAQLTEEAQKFVSDKIATLRKEGKDESQAAAIAYSMAREAGYEIPEQK
jgi:hypothetical protein